MNFPRIYKAAIILLVAISVFISAVPNAYAIKWEYNLYSAFTRAKRYGKPLMIDFYAAWSAPCRKLHTETFTDGKVDNLSKKFICVKIYVDKNRDLVKAYNINAYPTVIFMDKDKRILDIIVGFRDAAVFVPIMKGVLSETDKIHQRKRAGAEKAAEEQKQEKKQDEKEKQKQKEPKKKTSPFDLTGIVYDPEDAIAVINNAFVKVGDEVEGAKIVRISETRVTLLDKNREIILDLE